MFVGHRRMTLDSFVVLYSVAAADSGWPIGRLMQFASRSSASASWTNSSFEGYLGMSLAGCDLGRHAAASLELSGWPTDALYSGSGVVAAAAATTGMLIKKCCLPPKGPKQQQ